jgi:preprotein translocase subunit SecG
VFWNGFTADMAGEEGEGGVFGAGVAGDDASVIQAGEFLRTIFWIQAITFTMILVLGIVVTYKTLQATADDSDYGMEYSQEYR